MDDINWPEDNGMFVGEDVDKILDGVMEKKDKKIMVEAPSRLANRRGKTFGFLKSADYRKLKEGGAVLIDVKYFDKTLFREVKSGNK